VERSRSKDFDAADGKAEYSKCVEISTAASIREMVLPGMVAVLSPVLIGLPVVQKCWVVCLPV
jgi:Na+/H+-translocating membrane pyrophosphatase